MRPCGATLPSLKDPDWERDGTNLLVIVGWRGRALGADLPAVIRADLVPCLDDATRSILATGTTQSFPGGDHLHLIIDRSHVVGDIWTVPAIVTRVVDADTLALRLSLGWHIYLESRVRLVGINAPEMSTEEGKAARGVVCRLLESVGGQPDGSGAAITFVSHSLDKYGRPLGQVLMTTPQGAQLDLGAELMALNLAVPMR